MVGIIRDDFRQEYPFQSRYFTTPGGQKLHYVDEGSGDHALVMVHGNPTWSFYFRHLIRELRRDYRVLALDHMGCGESDRPQQYAYTLEQHIENMGHWLQSMKVSSYSLILHDWGGAIGLGAGLQNFSSLKNVILMNTAAFTSIGVPYRILLGKLPGVGNFLIRRMNAFVRGANKMAVTKQLSPTVEKGFIYPYQSYQNRVAVAQFVKDIPTNKHHPSYQTLACLDNDLGKFNVLPQLLLWGARDFCFHMGYLKEWQRRWPKARVRVLHDVGHYVLEDNFAAAKEEITSFLQEH